MNTKYHEHIMKLKLVSNKIIILSLFMLVNLFANAQFIKVKGRISNVNKPNDTTFKVYFYKNNILEDSVKTTLGGFYTKTILTGTYKIIIHNLHLKPTTISNLVLSNNTNHYNFKLNGATVSSNGVNQPSIAKYEELKTDLEKKDVGKSIAYSSAKMSKSKSSSKISPKRAISVTTETTEDYAVKSLDVDKEYLPSTIKPTIAGQVTAGHWSDIEHWDEWLITNQLPEISIFQNTWGIYPKIKSTIQFIDLKGKPLTFCPVVLLNTKNEKLWEATTDQNGNAYFWYTIFSNTAPENIDFNIQINNQIIPLNGKYFTDSKKKAIVVNTQNKPAQLAEIAFVVDATGSMGDEIKFLQVELLDVINRIQKKNECVTIHTGSVFYRDNGDEYLTRTMPFSSNPSNTLDFISNQNAGGGGDFPEAVDIALQDGLNKLNWTEGNHAKIMFLLLDAPPHQDIETKKRIRSCIQQAAAKGIRIVPIAASGIDKTTEFLLKYMAIITNGEYLYITDDSKIGNSHLKPTGGESKVEYLNDLMVNTINTYINAEWCKNEKNLLPSDTLMNDSLNIQDPINHDVIVADDWQITFYPNPATNYFYIETSKTLTQLIITDINGKELINQTTFGEGKIKINTEQWSSGMYIVKAIKNQEVITGKVLILN